MSGFIEFCVELKSASEGGAAAEMDGEMSSQQPTGQDGSSRNGRGGRRGMLRRQSSVLCSRVHSLNTISYVDNGKSEGDRRTLKKWSGVQSLLNVPCTMFTPIISYCCSNTSCEISFYILRTLTQTILSLLKWLLNCWSLNLKVLLETLVMSLCPTCVSLDFFSCLSFR